MPRLLYSETASEASLAASIDAYWSVFVDPEGPGQPCHWVLPDGCYTLSIGMRPKLYCGLRAPSLLPFRAPCVSGERIIGVRFRPGIDPRPAVRHLQPHIRLGQSPEEIFALIERWSAREIREPDRRLDNMVTWTRASEGSIPLADVAGGSDLSERQLERLSIANVGLTPKAFARITRLQAIVRRMIAEPTERLADVAARFNLTDQSYMTREFVKLAQLTPAAYKRMIADVGFVLDP